jgi:hypothetical protein
LEKIAYSNMFLTEAIFEVTEKGVLTGGMGDVQVAAAGAGPWDGFASYVIFGSERPRWGDYGAAAVGSDIWVAAEYVAQTGTYAQYLSAPGGSMRWYAWCAGQLVYARQQSNSSSAAARQPCRGIARQVEPSRTRLRLIEDFGAAEVWQRAGRSNSSMRGYEFYRLACASVQP